MCLCVCVYVCTCVCACVCLFYPYFRISESFDSLSRRAIEERLDAVSELRGGALRELMDLLPSLPDLGMISYKPPRKGG